MSKPLTLDQSYCMTRLCEGVDGKDIAREMGCSHRNVAKHLRRARRNLGASTREQACGMYTHTEAWTRTHR